MQAPTINREQWLTDMIGKLRPMFKDASAPLPDNIRVTCGWPSRCALSAKKRRIGECWPTQASADQTHEILISPAISEGTEVAAVLVHELIHVAVGTAAGHRAPFSRLAKTIGLVKPWTATVAGPELTTRLNVLITTPYPHAKLDARQSGRKKDGTRLLKLECPDCGYTVRTTAKWIEIGYPTCPCGTEMTRA